MRKPSLFVCGSLVLLGMLVLQAPGALATELEPDCVKYPLPNGINGFHVVTVPSTAGAIADPY